MFSLSSTKATRTAIADTETTTRKRYMVVSAMTILFVVFGLEGRPWFLFYVFPGEDRFGSRGRKR